MSAKTQALFWIGAGVALVVLLATLRDILLPFVLGAAIAYLLDPVADRLQRLGLSRLWATVLVVSLVALSLVLLLFTLMPLILEQFAALARQLPLYFEVLRDVIESLGRDWRTRLPEADLGLQRALDQLAQGAADFAGRMLTSLWAGGLALVNFLALLIVTPVVAFYLLKDWDRMIAEVDSWLPRRHAPTIRALAAEIDEVLSGFVRGQLTVLLLLSLIFVVGLTLVGLRFGLLIGLGAGLISFVPFLGPLVGFVVGGIMAVVQFWPDWVPVAAVIGVFALGQLIESYVLSPLIVGDRVRLHPVWLIFALFVFGYLFGFVGLLLAVPIAAAIGVLVRFSLRQYRASPLYTGTEPTEPKAE